MSQGNASLSPVPAACAISGSPAKVSHYTLAKPLLTAWGAAERAKVAKRIARTNRYSAARSRDVCRFREYALAIGRAFALALEPKQDDDQPKAQRVHPLIAAVLANAAMRARFRRIAEASTNDATGADLAVSLDRHPRQGRYILRMTPRFLDHASANHAAEIAKDLCHRLGFRIVLADIIRSAHRPNKGAIMLHIERRQPAQTRSL